MSPLLAAAQTLVLVEQRAMKVRVMPLARITPVYESDTFGDEQPVVTDGARRTVAHGVLGRLRYTARRHHPPAGQRKHGSETGHI